MASKEEILQQIADLQAEADGMGDGEEFDVEIWNEKGEGARLPHGQTTRWLRNKFPELFDPEPDPDADNDADNDGKTNPPKRGGKPAARSVGSGQRSGTAGKYFGKRPAGK
jgi:hypothetical protein